MAVSIISPKFSFVQFDESTAIASCLWGSLTEVLPVVFDNDLAFQFILETDNKSEADTLCADSGTVVTLGLANNCIDSNILIFSDLPERYRLSDTLVLYNWAHGIPLFQTVIDDGECFLITINVTIGPIRFCSNLFKRTVETCFTGVLEYGNDDNFADFNYCGGIEVDPNAADCTPLEISFSSVPTITIPYTAQMQAKYGNVPTVQVWIRDDSGILTDMGILVQLDSFPPTQIYADFGGLSSGVIKIS